MAFNYLPMLARRAAPKAPRELKPVSQPGWHPMAKPLSESRVSLLTSAALREAHQPAFPPIGDTSYRSITSDLAVTDLKIVHRSHVGTDARLDPEIVFPRTALTVLAERGIVGSVAPFHFSFVGGIRLYRELQEDLAPHWQESSSKTGWIWL